MLPGASPAPCTLTVTYSGVSAYMGLDVLIATKAIAPGTLPLYHPSDSANDLQITTSDSQSPTSVTYVTPSTTFSPLSSCPSSSGFDSSYTCYELADLLVSTAAFTGSSSAVTFSTAVHLPASSKTGYQYGTASVVLTAHAVQSANNNFVVAGSCTAGNTCGTAGNWS